MPEDHSQTTARLLTRIRDGDANAREMLFDRHRRELSRWAHGRLPRGLRDVRDTDDLVQDAMVRALRRIDWFEPEHAGSFLAYLCRILDNLVRDEMRAAKRRPKREILHDDHVAQGKPVDATLDLRQVVAEYRRALGALPVEQREAVVMRFELGLPYEAIAEEMGKPNVTSVRTLVSRGLARLADAMRPLSDGD